MQMPYEQLRDAALALPPAERIQLADMLSVSLRRSDQDLELSPEFVAELKRRSADMDKDEAAGSSWEDVRAEMLKSVTA